MANGIVFWGVVTACAGFYFEGTVRRPRVAGQHGAAATSVVVVMLVIPSFVLFFREALWPLRR